MQETGLMYDRGNSESEEQKLLQSHASVASVDGDAAVHHGPLRASVDVQIDLFASSTVESYP